MTSTETSTRAEICAVACAEIFSGAGEIMASPMSPMSIIGARLAKLTTEPDLLLSDGEALLFADTPRSAASRRSRAGFRSAGCSMWWPPAAAMW